MFSSTTPQDALALSTNTARFAPRLSASRPIWAGARKQVEKHAALQIKLQNVEKRLFYAVRRGTHSIARERFQFSASAGTGYDTHSRTLLSLLEVRVRNLKNMYGHTSSYYLI